MPDNIVNVDFHRRFQIRPGERVLDLGSGTGRHTVEACIWPCQVVSVDILRTELRQTKFMVRADQARGRLQGDAEFLVADAENLPFADHSFDKIICTEVLEHISDDGRGIQEMLRVLKPGGEIAVSVPNFLPEAVFWRLSWGYWHSPGGHVRIYRPGELEAVLRRAGLEVHGTEKRHAVQSIYWFVRCGLGIDRPEVLPTRKLKLFIDWYLERRPRALEAVEARVLNPLIGKDMTIYCRKPAGASA
ncbi:MAG TPA: methyltransferase domain-containing protein [Dehalococcoidia bacterium]